MTFADLKRRQKHLKESCRYLRAGQSYMIALSEINFEMYEKITGTEYDCFFNDNLIPKFLGYLEEHNVLFF